MININKVIKNVFSISVGNIIGQVISFITIIYLARFFGPSGFGIINFANVWVTYFSALSYFGLQSLAVIEISKAKENVEHITNEILSLRIVLSILSFVFLCIIVTIVNLPYNTKVMIILSGLGIIFTSILIDWFFTGIQEMKYISLNVILRNVFNFAFLMIAYELGLLNNITIVPICNSAAILLSNLYLVLVGKQKFNLHFKFIFNYGRFKNILLKSGPFFFSGVFATVNSNIDTLLIGILRSDFEVGLYNSVYKIVNLLIISISYIFTPLFPVLIDYFNSKKFNLLEVTINSLIKIILILAIPLSSVGLLLNKEIINTLYGASYSQASGVFRILIIYVALLYVREIYGYQLSAYNMQNKYMRVVIISATFNIISNIIFIPRFGIIAAAINTLLSEIINVSLMVYYIKSNIKMKTSWKAKNNIIINTVLMGVVITLCKRITSNAYILSFVGFSVYLIGLFVFRTITVQELKQILKRVK